MLWGKFWNEKCDTNHTRQQKNKNHTLHFLSCLFLLESAKGYYMANLFDNQCPGELIFVNIYANIRL